MEKDDIREDQLPETNVAEETPEPGSKTALTKEEAEAIENNAPSTESSDSISGNKKKKTTTKKKKTESEKLVSTATAEETITEKAKKPTTRKKTTAKKKQQSAVSSESTPALGQAEVNGIRVEVVPVGAQVGEKTTAGSKTTKTTKTVQRKQQVSTTTVSKKNSLVPETTDLQGASVQLGPVLSANTITEVVQTAILPFHAIKVRNVVGKIVNLTAEVIPNKVIVQGVIHEQLYFVGSDDLVHHLADDINFSTFLDVPGAMPGMNVQINAVIETILTELVNGGRSIIKKFVLEVFVKVTETVQLNLLPGNGPLVLLDQVIGENAVQTLVETDLILDLPAIKVDEIVGSIRDLEIEIIPDKVIIQGILHKQVFYVDTDNLERHQAEDVPFSTFVDLPGALPGMDAHVFPRIEAILFELISPSLLRQKAVLEFFVKITETVRQQVTPGMGSLFKVPEFIGENTVQQLNETTVNLAVPAVKVREIVARIQDLESFVIADKVIVQGTLHKQIFYIGTDDIERHQAEDIPISLFLDIPGAAEGDNVSLTPVIEAIFFDLISPTQLRQKVVFAIKAVISRELQLNLVVGVGELFQIEQVVGENTRQVLIVRTEEITPPGPVLPSTITRATLVFPKIINVTGNQQIIINNEVELPVTAIKIKEIQGMILDLKATIITDGVLVQGNVEKTVFFVDTENIVRTVTEIVPFSIIVNIPGISTDQVLDVSVVIESITFALNESGDRVMQNIVLEATVTGQSSTDAQEVSVVTDVSGQGIVQSKVRVLALVRTAAGDVRQEIDVVTDVSGPGIGGVIKRTLLLDVVGDGNPSPVPVEVVVDVELA